MKLTKQQVDEILDAVWDFTEYEIETCGYHDYDISPSMTDKSKQKVAKILLQILTENGKTGTK